MAQQNEVEALLSVEYGEGDEEVLYRIRRGDRVVYVSVPSSIFPSADPIDRVEESSVLRVLRKIPEWNRSWTTLSVEESQGQFRCRPDAFKPHGLSELLIRAPHYNLLDLQRIKRLNHVVSVVSYQGTAYVMKIASFEWELRYLQREIQAYSKLQAAKDAPAPQFVGYVYEESQERIMGFLMELLPGRHADPEDEEICIEAVKRLHTLGISHRDLYKFNIVIHDKKAKLIDFAAAAFEGEDSFAKGKDGDLANLAAKLGDTSGLGEPFSFAYDVAPP